MGGTHLAEFESSGLRDSPWPTGAREVGPELRREIRRLAKEDASGRYDGTEPGPVRLRQRHEVSHGLRVPSPAGLLHSMAITARPLDVTVRADT